MHRIAAKPPRLSRGPIIRWLPAWAGASLGGLIGAALLGGALIGSSPLNAQDAPPAPPPGAAPPPPPGGSAPGRPLYSAAQLEQMVAPVALYPDDLLGQVLMAATYPLEIVQADRWLQDPGNASLTGPSLEQALQALPWDPSVKSLVAYPQVLSMMDNGLEWTESLGDAFLAQQGGVMDAVQRLRARARAAGTLSSTPQQQVTTQDGAIEIAPPPDTGVEYVPVYDPTMAYGPWPYADYPPEELFVPGYPFGTFITFPIVFGFWGWDHWDWHHHRIDIDGGVGTPGWSGRGPGGGFGRGAPGAQHPVPVPWHHDPGHRGGVPYRDPVTRTRFEGSPDRHSVGSGYRGYTNTQRAPAQQPVQRPMERPVERPAAPPPSPRPPPMERPAPMPRVEAPRVQVRPAPVAERPVAPAFESFGRGQEVHVQEQRGFASRASPPGGGGGGRPGGHR